MKYYAFMLILIISLQVNANTGIPWKVEPLDTEFHVHFKPQDIGFPDYLQLNSENYINNETNRAFYPRTRTKILWRGLFPLDNDYIEPGVISHGYSGYNGSMNIDVIKLTASEMNVSIIVNDYARKSGIIASSSTILLNQKITESQTITTQFQESGLRINNETLPDYLLYSEIEIYLELNEAQNWNHEAELVIQFHGHQNPTLSEYLFQNYAKKQGIITTSTNIDSSSSTSDTSFSALQLSPIVLIALVLPHRKRNRGP